MNLLGWSTKQILKVSGYVESFIAGRLFNPQAVRGLGPTPELIRFSPPVIGTELKIVHLSDLHFGVDHPTKREQVLNLLHQLKPHLIIVSGDIVNIPDDTNFRRAKEYLAVLATHARLLSCPGNHDRHGLVNLDAYMNGLDVTRGPYDCKFLDFGQDLRVTAYIFNSTPAQIADAPRDAPAPLADRLKESLEQLIQVRGWIDPKQLEQMRTWRDHLVSTKGDAFRESVKIAVMHHHPLPTSMATYQEQFLILLNSGEVLDCLMDLDIDIVFHGHQHDPLIQTLRRGAGDQEMFVLSAGTATKSSDHGREEKTKTVSRDTGLFLVTLGQERLRVEQYNYANAFDLVYKFIPTRRLDRPWHRRPFLRYRVAIKWIIKWPEMDLTVIEEQTLLARADNETSFSFTTGCNVPATFEELGFTVTRKRDQHQIAPPKIVESTVDKTVDAVGDKIDSFAITLLLDPPMFSGRGGDDVLTFSYTWPRGFEDLKTEHRVQSDISFGQALDEFSLDVEMQDGGGGIALLVLPCGTTAKEGLCEPVTATHARYQKEGVPEGMVFNYQLTRTGS